MTAYFVAHPYMDKTAVVHAPSTEKARTVFLDWLERGGSIQRRHRQAYRRDMVAKRLEDPGVPADVELHYGYLEESPIRGYRLGREQPTVEDLGEQEVGDSLGEYCGPSFEDYAAVEEVGHLISAVPQPVEEALRPRRMPIQEVMLRGYE